MLREWSIAVYPACPIRKEHEMQSSAENGLGEHGQIHDSKVEPESEPLGYARYISAAFGGFMVGFAELLRAGDDTTNVTVLRIAAVLRQQFTPLLGAGWIALLALALFSIMLCSIYRPGSRRESFTLGLSVFAMLAAFTPQEKQRLQSDAKEPLAFLSFVSAAYAEPLRSGQLGDYYFEFTNLQPRFQDKSGLLSVFDRTERFLLTKIPFDTREIARLQLPKGAYVLQFECNGCARVRANLLIEKPEEAAKVRLSSSNVSLSLQRLVGAEQIEIDDVPDGELDQIKQRYIAQHLK
jgi:hypothetical protein